MKLNADKSKSYRLWTSYGVATQLLQYLPRLETIRLQALNQFSYEVLISRVQTQLQFFTPFYFCFRYKWPVL